MRNRGPRVGRRCASYPRSGAAAVPRSQALPSFSFPGSAWERPNARLRLAANQTNERPASVALRFAKSRLFAERTTTRSATPACRYRHARTPRRGGIERNRHDRSGRYSSATESRSSVGRHALAWPSALWKNNLHKARPAAASSMASGSGKLEALGGGQKSACGSALTWYARTRYADQGASKRHPKRPSKRPTGGSEPGCKSFP